MKKIKLDSLNDDLYSKSSLTNEQMKMVYGGSGTDTTTDTDTTTSDVDKDSTVCTGKANSTKDASNRYDNDPCTDPDATSSTKDTSAL